MHTINITEAKNRFSELISRASAGDRFIIRKHDRAMAVLIGSGEFERLERFAQVAFHLALMIGQDEAVLQRVERGEVHPAMAAFGLWRNEDDLENLAEQIDARRNTTVSRLEVDL